MTPSEYLDACKAKIAIQSDYELAKRLEIPNANIPPMRRGERAIPIDVMFKIAITLELDPSKVVADLESQREKNERRRGFWHSFMSRAAAVAVLTCTLALSFSGISDSAAGIAGGSLIAVAAGAAFLRLRKTHNLCLCTTELAAS